MLSTWLALIALSLMARIEGFLTTTVSTFRKPHHEVAMSVFWNDAGTLVDEFYQTQPYLAAFLTCSVKSSAADIVAQTRQAAEAVEAEQKRQQGLPMQVGAASGCLLHGQAWARPQQQSLLPPLDLSRNVGFLLYGGIYQGMVQTFLFNHLYPDLFGRIQPAWMAIAAQVSMDTMVTCPCVCIPLAYIIKSLFDRRTSVSEGMHNGTMITTENERQGDFATFLVSFHHPLERAFASGLAQYWHDVMHNGLLQTYWSLWIPVQTLTFSVVSPAYRIVFVACVSFFWVALLSSIIANSQERQQEPAPPLLMRPPSSLQQKRERWKLSKVVMTAHDCSTLHAAREAKTTTMLRGK